MGESGIPLKTWRVIYDTIQKQRGELEARDCTLGRMFTLIDEYEATLRKARSDALEDAAVMLENEIDPFGDNPADYDTCAIRVRNMKDYA